MSDDLVLRFTHGDGTVELSAVQVGTVASAHTGRDLRELQTEITCSEQDASALHELLETSPITDEDGVKWTGVTESESYMAGGPHTLVIRWTEHEHLTAESVEFEGLVLQPTEYEELLRDGVVGITFRARLTEEETKALRALQAERGDESQRYWPVVRHGVSEEPRRMRFGRVLWQQQGDRFEHLINLVDESQDKKQPDVWLGMRAEPELGHLIAGASDLAAQFDALLDTLVTAGTLEEQAITRIREAGREARRQREYTFYEVDDLSRWS